MFDTKHFNVLSCPWSGLCEEAIAECFMQLEESRQNLGKNIMSNIASVCSQQYTNNSVFWVVEMIVCIMMLDKYPGF